jgi:hypothetical protein
MSCCGYRRHEFRAADLPMTQRPQLRKTIGSPLIVLLLAFAAFLRFYKLDSQLWLDEVVTLVNSYREPFWKILTKFPGHFPHPLYERLAHGSLALFGESAFAIRLPAALFGVAGIFMFYKLSRRFSGESEALFGTALLTFSYHHIYFSQDARGYTLYLFLALTATDRFLDVLQKMRWQSALAYTGVTALAAYSQTAGLTVAPGQIAPDFPAVKNLSDLMREEASGRALWVITTFERVEARQRPDLLARLRKDYQLMHLLPASTGDGEMRVYFRPASPATAA